jgi:pimeloyl-ACP methyl ester carboxylesterase
VGRLRCRCVTGVRDGMDSKLTVEMRARRVALPSRGGEMAVLDFGPADRPVDVIFSHANGFNGLTYRSIMTPLAVDMRILAVDLRGHGASRLPAVTEGRTDWSDFSDDLVALLNAEIAAPVVLAGHSMGGTSSLLAAAQAPQDVKALALFDPVLFDVARMADVGRTNPLAQGAARRRSQFASKADAIAAYTGRGAFRTWQAEQLADYVEAGFRAAPDGQVRLTCEPAWEASNFDTHGSDAWTALRSLGCPVRMLRAEIGSTARIDDNLDELGRMGHVNVEVVPATTHFLPMERPDLVRRVLRDLVDA